MAQLDPERLLAFGSILQFILIIIGADKRGSGLPGMQGMNFKMKMIIICAACRVHT